VGTRSALFLPVPDPALIVLDEEHDASFKQDEGLPYQAKEVAWFRAGQARALLLLGSATPDVKTFYAARRGDIPMDRLPARVGGGRLPEISLIDIRGVDPMENPLAPDTLRALREVTAKGEQAVMLLNRRGYAPHMYCLDCGSTIRCPDCDIALTYHKARERLICHYCGHSIPFPVVCAKCRGLHYLPMGQGTERLEEHIATILPPGGRVLRLDRDSTRRPGRMEEILEAFAHKEAQVLVGTQMLSKGHHFPEVTLAVIADGDMGLNLPDYRAAERTFQLLVQTAGRAGRGEKPGRVIIQTRDTSHYCWRFVQNADYEGFYAKEIALREKRRYPPFVRLALVRMSFPAEWAGGPEAVATASARLRSAGQMFRVTTLGPAPAPLPLLRARRRFHCLLKADDWGSIRNVFAAAADAVPGKLRIALDLDPINML
jgi:primosomal protein N' (replication factor Y)